MKGKLLAVLLVLAALAMLIGPVLLGLSAVIFGAAAAAAQDPCQPTPVDPDESGEVRLPVTGAYTVTSEYGMRRNPGPFGTGVYKLHDGVDLAMGPGPRTVVAAAAGVVAALPDDPDGGGSMVVLDHGGGLTTVYMHLASRSVALREAVWPGKPLGAEGSTGNSTGPHLHFTVKVSGRPVDPRPWLAERGLALPATGGASTAPPAVPARPQPPATPPATPTPSPTATSGTGGGGTGGLPDRVGPYRGEQVVNAGLVIRAGRAMGLDARTVTIGVMTAMGESSLVNIGYGDAAGPDSRGLFQQRANGAWGSLADRMDPTTASTNFFKALLRVPGYLDLEPTIAAHRTQRNADPYHYRRYWADAVLMVATLTEDPALLDELDPGGRIDGCGPDGPPGPGDGSGAAIAAAAQHYLGTPYSWGGGTVQGPSLGIYSSPSLDGSRTVGFDCSGLVLFAVHSATGIELPHSAEAQGRDPRGAAVPRDFALMRPGDVVSFSQDGSGSAGSFGHVGIYIGGGKMIHAPRPGRSVEVVQLQGSAYYEAMAWSIRRYAADPGTAQGDEFNGSALDPAKWRAYGGGLGRFGYTDPFAEHCYTASNVSVSGGSLRIRSGPGPAGCGSSGPALLSGFVASREAGRYYPLYGRFEMRARIPYGQGVFPAFWLRHAGGADRVAEVDIMESFFASDPGGTTSTIHLPATLGTNVAKAGTAVERPPYGASGSGWHVWAVDIAPAGPSAVRFAFSVDGAPTLTWTDRRAEGWLRLTGPAAAWSIAVNTALGGRHVGSTRGGLGWIPADGGLCALERPQRPAGGAGGCAVERTAGGTYGGVRAGPPDGRPDIWLPPWSADQLEYEIDYIRVYPRGGG